MIRFATMSFAVLVLPSCATSPEVPSAVRSELTPTGKLRVAIGVSPAPSAL